MVFVPNSYHRTPKIIGISWLVGVSFVIWNFRKGFNGPFHCCCLVIKPCPTLCHSMDCSMPGFHVLHYLQEFAHIHVHWVGDAIQPSHPLSVPSPALNLSRHWGHSQWVSSLHHLAKVLELQHQSFLWIFRVEFL